MKIPKRVEKWVEAMEATTKGRQVLDNLKEDENIPASIAKEFFNRLNRGFGPSKDPFEHMNKVLASIVRCALAGPQANTGLQLLTRFASLARLVEKEPVKKMGLTVQNLIDRPHLVDIIKELPLGNRREIVWAALFEPIDEDISHGFGIDLVVNKLGIGEKLEEPMFQVRYHADDGGSCYVPTVLDAGANHRFRPSGKGAAHGMTKPCSEPGDGYPEWVHAKCTAENPDIKLYTDLG